MRHFLFATFILFVTSTTVHASPTEFVEALLTDVAIINAGDGDKTAAFKTFLEKKFDVPRIGRFLVGRVWKSMDNNTKVIYLATFKNYILSIWSDRLGSYSGKGKVKNEKIISDGSVLVTTNVTWSGNKKVTVIFRISNKSGSYRIIDVMTENISLLVAMRSDFKSILVKRGIDGLIVMMEKKTNG